jgi:hypothetical protein
MLDTRDSEMTPSEFTFCCYKLNLNLLRDADQCFFFVDMSIFNNINLGKGIWVTCTRIANYAY